METERGEMLFYGVTGRLPGRLLSYFFEYLRRSNPSWEPMEPQRFEQPRLVTEDNEATWEYDDNDSCPPLEDVSTGSRMSAPDFRQVEPLNMFPSMEEESSEPTYFAMISRRE